jgi:hypothetical protein
MDAAGLTLGPIGLTIGDSAPEIELRAGDHDVDRPLQSIHSMTTAAWRAKYEKDGKVDLWVEEEFNAGSRLVVRSHPLLSTTYTATPCAWTRTRLVVTCSACPWLSGCALDNPITAWHMCAA